MLLCEIVARVAHGPTHQERQHDPYRHITNERAFEETEFRSIWTRNPALSYLPWHDQAP